MKKILVLYCCLLFMSCSEKKDIELSDLNATWIEIPDYNKRLNYDKHFSDYIAKIRSSSQLQKEFSWGKGYFNVNGSWYFDINKDEGLFYPDGGPVYRIINKEIKSKKIITLSLVSSEIYNEYKKNEVGNKEWEIVLHIRFIQKNVIEIINPDKRLFIENGGPVYLFRVTDVR